jgi:DNA-binding LacI/PurR family transcriptional regulator
MRARIEKVAAMLGYRPSRLPGIMRRGKSGIVAVVVGGFYNPFHTMTLESFTRADLCGQTGDACSGRKRP